LAIFIIIKLYMKYIKSTNPEIIIIMFECRFTKLN
jgi:hypothetical protein